MKREGKKRPGRVRRFFAVLGLVVLGLAVVLLNAVRITGQDSVSQYLGFGRRIIETPARSEGVDAAYYVAQASNTEDARRNAEAVSERVADEGEILLKNDGVLPLAAGATVTPFGYAYLNPAYAGTGAGAGDASNNVSPEVALGARLAINGATAEAMAAAEPVVTVEAQGTTSATGSSSLLTSSNTLMEYDPAIYAEVEDTMAGTCGIVFVTRQGNEGSDKKMDAYEDGTAHYLALSANELATVRFAKEHCDSVVVVVVSSNAMELGPLMSGELEANAIVWMGTPGSRGFVSLAKLLVGEVNFSGRTVDTFPRDFTADPTYQNMGEFSYSNYDAESETPMPQYYLEYQEGVYLGYRYYETADAMDGSFTYGTLDAQGASVEDGAVCYPFGYGLSYTTFDQEVVSFDGVGDEVCMTVRVTNTGSVAGKDVAQAYVTAPYTQFDVENGIEKPVVVLATFGKTALLEPGASQEVELVFSREDVASYCASHANADGTLGCYVLEEGPYVVSLCANSHDVIDECTFEVGETTWFEPGSGRSTDLVVATNQFQASTDYMASESVLLTRADWTSTQPEAVAGRAKPASDAVLASFAADQCFDPETDPVLGNVEGSEAYAATAPASGADNGLALSDLRGADYDDPRWDELLDQIDYAHDRAQLCQILFGAGYQTAALDSIGKPSTTENDGDAGFRLFGVSSCSWVSKPVFAATWNVELVREAGAAFGQEALAVGLNGLYAPGLNIHRSPFSGRNFEYFSEDPLLSGKLAAAEIGGAGDEGLYCFMKHFAVNDEETHRELYLNVWAGEQTMRELYFRGFEIATKESVMTVPYVDADGNRAEREMPAAVGVMSAQTCIGTEWCFTSNALLNNVLRGEWGFNGEVITDLYMTSDGTVRDHMLRAGGDTFLMVGISLLDTPATDLESATAQAAIRNAIHHVAYTAVNSAAMNGMAPGATVRMTTPAWVWAVCAVTVGYVALVVLAVRRMRRR